MKMKFIKESINVFMLGKKNTLGITLDLYAKEIVKVPKSFIANWLDSVDIKECRREEEL